MIEAKLLLTQRVRCRTCLEVRSRPGCHFHCVHNLLYVDHLKDSEGVPDTQPDIATDCEVDIM